MDGFTLGLSIHGESLSMCASTDAQRCDTTVGSQCVNGISMSEAVAVCARLSVSHANRHDITLIPKTTPRTNMERPFRHIRYYYTHRKK
jgi:riboflavin synthase alpha subunit